jgi:outer membrane biosynthesis protein TonB
MPSLETPPSPSPSGTPDPNGSTSKVRTGRYGELEEHELIHLLDSLDDDRSKARFRESIYISIIFYLAVGWFLFYGPRVLFHQPRLINPADVLKQRDKEMTYLDMPKDISKNLPRKPTNVISDKDRTQQTTKPTLDKKTLEQLQAMRKAGPPAPTTAPPAPQQAPLQQQSPQQQAQQQPLAPQPQKPPPPQQQAMVDAPRPAPTRPNFGNQNQSASSAIRQATQGAAQNRGGGGDYGANLPVAHQGLNTGVDILSDTEGVNFDPYLKKIIREIYNTWLPLIPEEARPPLNKSGETLVRFIILPNGKIGGMFLDGSTHDDAINRAAWGSITGVGQFPPLPSEFHGPNLELRIHYLVNKNPE